MVLRKRTEEDYGGINCQMIVTNDPRFSIGETVLIVGKSRLDMGWVPQMDRTVGCYGVIEDKEYPYYHVNAYTASGEHIDKWWYHEDSLSAGCGELEDTSVGSVEELLD